MYVDGDDILAGDPELTELYSANWKLADDPRVTPSGSHLRRFSIDELPQLLNVLRGEMSLVGPRPYMSRELRDEFGAHADRITSVKPGMTGLWQVSGRSQLSPADRIALDEIYVSNCGPIYDLRILFRTIKVVVRSHGAF
jgi:lipopolysaccharide/colanic/teichoic acid biosynthesis glycosyltransferase